ncbi:hypothetical protein [Streptomyces racemochromogenes]|uniref:hypothetical protein n=1 Tax=Streptomyces racemochromogenes TaxID=67353 RepID=UPI0031EC7512
MIIRRIVTIAVGSAILTAGAASAAVAQAQDVPGITSGLLGSVYSVGYTPKATSVNKIGLAGYLNHYGNRADLQTFYNQVLLPGI